MTSTYDPFVNSPWNQQMRNVGASNLGLEGNTMGTGVLPWVIKCDVIDSDKEYLVLAEVSGVPKDNLDVNIENSILSIRAEKEQKEMPENFSYDISEVCFGTDTRRLRLPANIDQDSAETCFKNGLLCIKFKKFEQHAPKKIEIGE